MTNLITLTIPNDDHIALRAFGKALEEMALAHGAEPVAETLVRQRAGDVEVEYLTRNAVAAKCGLTIEELDNVVTKAEVDTTAQQVESLAVPVEANGATYETDLGSDNPQPVPVADSTGTPWDERIHSASKALNSDGTWRLRRKPKDMDEAEWLQLVADVKLELSGEEQYDQEELARQSQELSQRYDIPEPPVTPPGDDFHTDAGVVTEQTVAGIPPIPVPPPVTTATLELNLPTPPHTIPVTVEAVNDWDFPKLMKFLTERHGKIDVPTVNALLAVDGLAALTDLNAHPDKIGPFVARVKAHLGE